MPAIWIFMWRRLPVLAAPSSQQEVIGIKLGCDICRCEMEMICKYNCLWREQNINTRHDQGMFNIYLALHTEIQNNAMVSWFTCSLLMLVNFRCSCRLQWYWRPCVVFGWPRPCLGQQGRRPSLICRPAAAHIPTFLLNIYKVIVTFICHISGCCIKHLLYFSMFLGVELYGPLSYSIFPWNILSTWNGNQLW